MTSGDYHISKDNESYLDSSFATREQAIEEGTKQYKKTIEGSATDLFDSREEAEKHPFFYIGKEVNFKPFVDECWVVESVIEQAYDFAGDYSDGYLERRYTPEENWIDLRNKFQKVFDDWCKETNNEPGFFMVEESELIMVKDMI